MLPGHAPICLEGFNVARQSSNGKVDEGDRIVLESVRNIEEEGLERGREDRAGVRGNALGGVYGGEVDRGVAKRAKFGLPREILLKLRDVCYLVTIEAVLQVRDGVERSKTVLVVAPLHDGGILQGLARVASGHGESIAPVRIFVLFKKTPNRSKSRWHVHLQDFLLCVTFLVNEVAVDVVRQDVLNQVIRDGADKGHLDECLVHAEEERAEVARVDDCDERVLGQELASHGVNRHVGLEVVCL